MTYQPTPHEESVYFGNRFGGITPSAESAVIGRGKIGTAKI